MGEHTMTGGRSKRVLDHVGSGDFCIIYGDGLFDTDIAKSIDFHRSHGRLAIIAAVYPPKRFSHLDIVGDRVREFKEKLDGEGNFQPMDTLRDKIYPEDLSVSGSAPWKTWS